MTDHAEAGFMPQIIDLTKKRLAPADLIGTGDKLNAISLWPPYGTAIAMRVKQNETRHWYRGFNGPIAIYQTKGVPSDAVEAYEDIREATGKQMPFGVPHPKECPLAAVVAVVRVVAGIAAPMPGKRPKSVMFFGADGMVEIRLIPPPPDSGERLFGSYDTTASETRFAWILTDIYRPPAPIFLPTGGGTRQGIFRLPEPIASDLLNAYKEYLIDARPKCKHCGCPIGISGEYGGGAAAWKFTQSHGWVHGCPHSPNSYLTDTDALEDADMAAAFAPGDFPSIRAEAAVDATAAHAGMLPPTLF